MYREGKNSLVKINKSNYSTKASERYVCAPPLSHIIKL